jgi:hypothetical protein
MKLLVATESGNCFSNNNLTTIMKQFIHLGWVALLLLVIGPGCKKKKDGGCTEAIMTVTTLPAEGSVEPASPGPEFPLTVNITSNLPTTGVSIEVKARPEGPTSEPFFTDTLQNVTEQNSNFMITGTPAGSAVVVDMK